MMRSRLLLMFAAAAAITIACTSNGGGEPDSSATADAIATEPPPTAPAAPPEAPEAPPNAVSAEELHALPAYTRSGIAPVDALIEAVQAGDAGAVRALAGGLPATPPDSQLVSLLGLRPHLCRYASDSVMFRAARRIGADDLVQVRDLTFTITDGRVTSTEFSEQQTFLPFASCARTARPPTAPYIEPPSSGITAVDTLVDAVLREDVDALLTMVRLQEMECVAGEPAGLGGPVRCDEGEAAGAVVAAFATAVCEGYWVRDPELTLEHFAAGAFGLYAVADIPDRRRSEPYWAVGDYVVVFSARRSNDNITGYAAWIEDGALVRTQLGCRNPGDFLRSGGEPLPLLVPPPAP